MSGTSMLEVCKITVSKLADNQLVIGPICWKPSDGTVSKNWYFTISGCTAKKCWWTEMVAFPPDWQDINLMKVMRADFAINLVAEGTRLSRALILHDCDDELYAIRLCELLWPGDRVRKVRQEIERERV